MRRTKLKKVYGDGGALIGPIAGASATILDAFETKKPKPALSAVKGVASGAMAGSQFGIWGAAAGAVLGGVSGLISGNKQKKTYDREEGLAKLNEARSDRAYSDAAIRANPALAYGNRISGYYEMGGNLAKNLLANTPAIGGSITPLSSQHTVINGPSHEQGGVDLPQYGAELEGQETTSGTRVFSEALGFAKLHRPIAKAIGKIEKKPATEERINALKRLQQKEDELFQLQEHIKAYSNVS